MSKELFPKRLKLKVNFKGALDGKTQEKYLFKTQKELEAKEAWYRSIYTPAVISFVRVPGLVHIINKPIELAGSAIMEAPALETIFKNVPNFANNRDTIWGRGFEDTLYVAKPDFSEIVKLKTK